MDNATMKVNCLLEGDSAIDFERLSMEFKGNLSRFSRQKQQSTMIGAAMLVLDATKQKCTQSTGKRYPTLVELLEFAGISDLDVTKLLGDANPSNEDQIAPLAAAIGSANKTKAGS